MYTNFQPIKHMKKFIHYTLAISAFFFAFSGTYATNPVVNTFVPAPDNADGLDSDGSIMKYRRSSLYSVLIRHSKFPYGNDIYEAFMSIPTPDKFNNHDCGPKTFESSMKKMKQKGKKKNMMNLYDIADFIRNNDIPRQMIAKWFNRNQENGSFNLDLMLERGFYDAQQLDIARAKVSSRGIQSLGDAGEELIGKTFLLVNDITFIDKGKRSEKAGKAFQILGGLTSAFTGGQNLGKTMGDAIQDIDGFTVNITSYLYRLDWSPDIAETFWSEYWVDDNDLNAAKKDAFNKSQLFSLSYVGQTTTSAENVSSKSMTKLSKSEQMKKVCARAIDKSIVQLQREYDEFKVNVPIENVDMERRTVKVPIGLKEGINAKSKFTVLLKVQNEDGSYSYEKVGKLQPLKKRIWDNRFGALDEVPAKGADNTAHLGATTFRVLEGANKIVPGCLVRESTIKRAK